MRRAPPAGYDPNDRTSSRLMLHTFVGDDVDAVREIVRRADEGRICAARSVGLIRKGFAWAFPAFKKRAAGREPRRPNDIDLGTTSPNEELDGDPRVIAFERYFETSAPVRHAPRRCQGDDRAAAAPAGVDDVACLIDFGVAGRSSSLAHAREARTALRQIAVARNAHGDAVAHEQRSTSSIAAQIIDRKATHLTVHAVDGGACCCMEEDVA